MLLCPAIPWWDSLIRLHTIYRLGQENQIKSFSLIRFWLPTPLFSQLNQNRNTLKRTDEWTSSFQYHLGAKTAKNLTVSSFQRQKRNKAGRKKTHQLTIKIDCKGKNPGDCSAKTPSTTVSSTGYFLPDFLGKDYRYLTANWRDFYRQNIHCSSPYEFHVSGGWPMTQVRVRIMTAPIWESARILHMKIWTTLAYWTRLLLRRRDQIWIQLRRGEPFDQFDGLRKLRRKR